MSEGSEMAEMAEMATEPVAVAQLGAEKAELPPDSGHVGVVQPMGTESSGP